MNKIICKHVPEALLKKEAAKIHFRQFGSVRRIVFRNSSRVITVEYNGADAVDKVIKYGNVYDNNTFIISKEPSDTMLEKPTRVVSKKGMLNKNSTVDLPDEVMAELDAMGGGPSLGLTKKNYPRQEVSNADTPKKTLKRRVPVEKDRGISKKTKPLAFSSDNEYQELLEILGQRAVTIEDKYKVLDARDKILRMVQKKSGTSTGFTRGTCPDMCPEKERLLRVIQHQVSYFEYNSSKEMDPCLAVKQYSRSSADQESPLPHELRPVGVLQTTMSYLINNIMSQGETSNVNIGDWYHFLWDRTRSIRKDITQQELCCRSTVELLEQCARFHIHCSARLVAEDPSVFDQKINTENLTKCLQTLKYMYHDLRLKGEKCPNEAEFRAYIILLNLNDGNFMWEVQGLPAEIQESPQIKNAIQIYSALNAYNFVKFFKLVGSSSYLNACILMRYFMQVRNRAIDVILRCYTPRITKVVYPLDTLTVNLGFESVHQTIEFVQLCGLNINDTRTGVILDKTSFVAPDLTYTAIDRSVNLVESKRADLSLGEIVCGGTVPIFRPHVPHDSFDEEGYLEKPFNAEDFNDEPLTEADHTNAEEATEIIPEKPTELLNIPEIQELSSEDENEEDSDIIPLQEVSHPEEAIDGKMELSDARTLDDKSSKVGDNFSTLPLFGNTNIFTNTSIFGNTVNQNKTNIFGGTTSLLEKNLSLMRNDGLPPVTDKTHETYKANDLLTGFNVSTASNTQIQFNKELPPKRLVDVFFSTPSTFSVSKENPISQSSVSSDSKLNKPSNTSCIDVMLQSFKQSVTRNEKRTKGNKFETMCMEQDDKIDREEIKESKKEKESSIRMKEVRKAVESLVSEIVDKVVSKEAAFKLQKLKSRILKRKIIRIIDKWRVYAINKKRTRQMQEWTCGRFNNMSLKEQADQFQILSKSSEFSTINYGRMLDSLVKQHEKKVDFLALTEILSQRHKGFSKKCASQPRDKIYWKCIISTPDSNEMPDSSHIINEKLQRYFGLKDDGSPLVIQQFSDKTPVRFCIEKQVGCGNDNNDAHGLIFVARRMNNRLYRRILDKFKNTGIFFQIPIVLILEEKPDRDSYNLKSLVKNGIISGYLLLSDCFQSKLINLVERSLKFLTSNVNPPPPIEVNYLETVLFRNFLCSELWKNATCYGISNPAYGKCLKNPNTVIRLYNDSLRRMKSFILDKSCYEYARFPLDFRQFEEYPDSFPMDYRHLPCIGDDLKYQQFISTLFDVVMPLKTFASWPPKSEEELQRIIWDFALDNFRNRAMEVNDKLLVAIMENKQYNDNMINDIMWTEFMDMLISEKSKCYEQFLKENTILESWQHHNQILVVYHTETLLPFLKSDWFYVTNPIIQELISYEQEMPAEAAALSDPTRSEIDETIFKVRCLLARGRTDVSKCNIEELNAQMDDLSECLRITKELSRQFRDLA